MGMNGRTEISNTDTFAWVDTPGDLIVSDALTEIGAPRQSGMPRKWIHTFYAEDINNDQCPDILFLYDLFETADTQVWLNNCDGYFTPMAEPTPFKPGSNSIPLDFDGDGDTDFLSAISRPRFYLEPIAAPPGEKKARTTSTFQSCST